jgi:hypothetical protein
MDRTTYTGGMTSTHAWVQTKTDVMLKVRRDSLRHPPPRLTQPHRHRSLARRDHSMGICPMGVSQPSSDRVVQKAEDLCPPTPPLGSVRRCRLVGSWGERASGLAHGQCFTEERTWN